MQLQPGTTSSESDEQMKREPAFAPLRAGRTRRRFLGEGVRLAGGVVWAALLPSLPARADSTSSASPSRAALLETSGLVYVSPLHPDGRESHCHGEVWFGWLDGAVVVITAESAWKARALAAGRDRARIWVGDHGRWKGWLWNNEKFRQAPSFDARAVRSDDADLLERLMTLYGEKYPAEIGDWEPGMREGFASGGHVLIRYLPVD